MNRRVFLFNQPIMFVNKNQGIIPVTTRQTNQNDTVFISNNKKMNINTVIDDYGSCVSVITQTEWFDPVTKTQLEKLEKNLYILESDEM